MIDTKWRSSLQPMFDVLARKLILLRVKPDHITWAAFGAGAVAGALVGMGQVFPSILLLWFSGLLDVLDGTVARLTKSASKGGAYMDLILTEWLRLYTFWALPIDFPKAIMRI